MQINRHVPPQTYESDTLGWGVGSSAFCLTNPPGDADPVREPQV